jgi:hypothetical protein
LRTNLNDLNDRLMFGEFVKRIENQDRFVIHPPRKWHYPGRLRAADCHVVQLYILYQGKIHTTSISSTFHVIPIWKSGEDKPATATSSKGLATEEESPDVIEGSSSDEQPESPTTITPEDQLLAPSPSSLTDPRQQSLYYDGGMANPSLSSSSSFSRYPNQYATPSYPAQALPPPFTLKRVPRLPPGVPLYHNANTGMPQLQQYQHPQLPMLDSSFRMHRFQPLVMPPSAPSSASSTAFGSSGVPARTGYFHPAPTHLNPSHPHYSQNSFSTHHPSHSPMASAVQQHPFFAVSSPVSNPSTVAMDQLSSYLQRQQEMPPGVPSQQQQQMQSSYFGYLPTFPLPPHQFPQPPRPPPPN